MPTPKRTAIKLTTLEKYGVFLYWGIKAFMLIIMLVSFYELQFLRGILIGLIILSTFIPSYIKKKYRLYFPIEFDLFITGFIFLSLFLGEIHNYYYRFPNWDIYLHAESGFLMGILGFILTYIFNAQQRLISNMKAGFITLFAFCFSMTIGTIWEIFEFSMDEIFKTNMQKSGLQDTMWDIIAVSFGAFVISIIGYFWMKKKIKFFVFDRSVSKFIQDNNHLFNPKKKSKNAPSSPSDIPFP